jgi:polar amino acid transport system substrate-binding protein/glutamate/aspartate transport system substrate-binding protein
MHVIVMIIAAGLLLLCDSGFAQTLDRVKESNTFRIGYRGDAPPFAYADALGAPAGYSVDLCRRVAVDVKDALSLPDMKVDYVEVSAENRFDMVERGTVDILCGPTTVTLARRARVDFSLPTFVDGASVLFREDGPADFESLGGQKVGVRAGTTTEAALVRTLEHLNVDAQVVPVSDHKDGLASLAAGEIAAYFADRAILLHLLRASPARGRLRLSSRYFTHEAYALAMTRGDDDFRLLVDRTLSRVYRSSDMETIFVAAFGPSAAPIEVLKVMYLINSLPD